MRKTTKSCILKSNFKSKPVCLFYKCKFWNFIFVYIRIILNLIKYPRWCLILWPFGVHKIGKSAICRVQWRCVRRGLMMFSPNGRAGISFEAHRDRNNVISKRISIGTLDKLSMRLPTITFLITITIFVSGDSRFSNRKKFN